MRPKTSGDLPTDDLFRLRLEQMIDSRHELVRLADLIDWSRFDAEFDGLFHPSRGAPAVPTRMIAGLHYLKHTFALSDEDVVRRWVENPYWQYFCGEIYFRHEMPIHPTTMTRWRKRIGESGCEWLLTETIDAARRAGALADGDCARVNVDTTVQEKNIAHPTDGKLIDDARRHLVRLVAEHGLSLRQNYNRVAKTMRRKIAGYGHAKQYRRMRRQIKLLKTRLGRVVRDIERQLPNESAATGEAFAHRLSQARQLLVQTKSSKNKLYSLHAPETECIAKGKAHKRYEFGVKVSFATTNRTGFVLGARSYPGNPYDGHTLDDQLQQAETLSGVTPTHCYVDRGYRGHGVTRSRVFIAGQRRLSRRQKRALRRRSAIEPEIGHMKNDGRLRRCFLKGTLGDAMNVILVGAGHNLRKLLAWLRAQPSYALFRERLIALITLISTGCRPSPPLITGSATP